jgi:hypothetical protein
MLAEITRVKDSVGKLYLNASKCENNVSAIKEQRKRIRDLRKSLKAIADAYIDEMKIIMMDRRNNRSD